MLDAVKIIVRSNGLVAEKGDHCPLIQENSTYERLFKEQAETFARPT
jgi:ABC-type transport system involved in Fe-S cluster assembly fused permease/ATPase subunit